MSTQNIVDYNRRQGFTDAQIKHIQAVVGVRADGKWGKGTVEAVMAWQRAEGLPPDGKVWNDPNGSTWPKLEAVNEDGDLDDDGDDEPSTAAGPKGIFDILKAAGIDFRDERVPGRPRRFTPIGVMLHHTASPWKETELNGVKMMKKGRPNLTGPLCQLYIGRKGSIVLVSEGLANHAGKGRSGVLKQAKAGAKVEAKGSDDTGGNRWFVGIEVENNGKDEPYTPETMEAIEAVTTALVHAHGWSENAVVGHKEWTKRKIDPRYDMDDMRAKIAARVASL